MEHYAISEDTTVFEEQNKVDVKALAKEIDQFVGRRIKLRRNILKLSQEQLADKIELTFQQVQKYEKGANRVGAGRLHIIASVLGVDTNYFFDGFSSDKISISGFAEPKTGDGDGSNFFDDDMLNPEIIKIIAAMRDIEDNEIRQQFVSFIKVIAKTLKVKDNAEDIGN